MAQKVRTVIKPNIAETILNKVWDDIKTQQWITTGELKTNSCRNNIIHISWFHASGCMLVAITLWRQTRYSAVTLVPCTQCFELSCSTLLGWIYMLNWIQFGLLTLFRKFIFGSAYIQFDLIYAWWFIDIVQRKVTPDIRHTSHYRDDAHRHPSYTYSQDKSFDVGKF